MLIPTLTLTGVFLLTAVRRVGRWRLQIWQVMLAGAAVVLACGSIKPAAALRAIDLDVMLFLFGMFVLGRAMEESGWLAAVSHRLFRRALSTDALVLAILLIMGGGSALLMNDTVAIVGTPVALLLARSRGLPPGMLLHALALAVTTGGVASPIGNPQNLLIALGGGMANPFVTFAAALLPPTLLNLLLAWLALRLSYPAAFRRPAGAVAGGPPFPAAAPAGREPLSAPGAVSDPRLARLTRLSLLLLLAAIVAKVALVFLQARFELRLTAIALAAALPLLVFSPRRFALLRRIDWPTLAFFAAMFVLMRSVWDTGLFQSLLARSRADLGGVPAVLGVSIGLSQLISNVPLVALYLPMLQQIGATPAGLAALAAGSTIAGNLLLLGAASNVIIVQNAESRSGGAGEGATLTFGAFARVGLPLTLLQAAVYWGWLRLVG